MVVGEEICRLFEQAGVTETERLVALNIARALVPVVCRRGVASREDELDRDWNEILSQGGRAPGWDFG